MHTDALAHKKNKPRKYFLVMKESHCLFGEGSDQKAKLLLRNYLNTMSQRSFLYFLVKGELLGLMEIIMKP